MARRNPPNKMVRLYLDEDVPEAIAIALRLRGCNVLTVIERLTGKVLRILINLDIYERSYVKIVICHTILYHELLYDKK